MDTTHTANLGSFTGPALIISAGRGFGSIMNELAEALGTTSVEVISNESFGHVDHYGTPDHWLTLELPILLWLTTEVFH